MGDTSVCYPWEYEGEVPTGTLTPHCHPGDSDDSLLCFFRLSYCLWYDSLEQLGHWHWDEIMAGFRACGVVVMVLWFLEFARAMHGEDRPELPAVDEDRPELPAVEGERPELPAVEGERPELPAAAVETPVPELAAAAVDEERPVPETPVPEPLEATSPEDRLAALSFSIDGLALAISSRPASVAPGSVVPLRATGARASAPDSAVPLRAPTTPGPRGRRRQRCRECGPCLAKLAAGVSRPPSESWAAVPGLERDSAGRFLPRTPAKREAGGDESSQDDDALDKEEEFNIDDLLASPVPAEKKAKKRRKRNPLPLPLPERREDLGPGDRGGSPDGGPGGAPVEVGNYF